MRARIRCHVVETPTNDNRRGREGQGRWENRSRELLPWADPYIAGLMRRLEAGFGDEDADGSSDPFIAETLPPANEWIDDGWQEDAFMPRPLVSPRIHSYPPIIGGFPLLDLEREQDV